MREAAHLPAVAVAFMPVELAAMSIMGWLEILFLVVLAIAAASLILIRDPGHFWQHAWLPALHRLN